MFIKEIELTNFRIYKGYNQISLLPSENKNVILISGKNGFGKTTFLMSLVWCLYGKQMEKVDELYEKEIRDKGNYTKYISNSLNRKAFEEGITEFSVAITFSGVNIPDVTCHEVKITRSYNVISNSSDRVEVLIDGHVNELIEDLTKENQRGEEIFIRDFILPIEIAKFFFFDAEKIVSLAEVNSSLQRKQLSKAYSEVLGIQKYEDLKLNLEEKQDDYRKKSAKPEEKQELNQLHADIENGALEIAKINSEIDILKDEKSQCEKDSDDIQRRLIRDGDKMTLEELNGLKDQQLELESKKNDLQEQLKEFYDLIPFALSGDVVTSVAEQIKAERAVVENAFKQESINEKIIQIRQDIEKEKLQNAFICDVSTAEFYDTQIKRLIKKYFFTEEVSLYENVTVLHDFSNSETNEFNQLVSTLKHSFKESFARLNSDYSSIKNQLDQIYRKIRDAEKIAENEYICSLRKKKDDIDGRVLTIDGIISGLNQQIGEISNQVKAFKQRQELLRKKIDESSEYSEKEKKTKQLISKLQNFIAIFKEEKKKSLEQKILEGLETLMHKKGFIKGVAVDISQAGDDIDINLISNIGNVIDKGSLSMGERQMYASALLNALVDESDIDFPVFIDSPMQKFDEEHAENIIRYFYPNVSKQVVIFPLINKELTAEEFEKLKPSICRTYLINNLSADSSQFIETSPDNFLTTYNEIYHAN